MTQKRRSQFECQAKKKRLNLRTIASHRVQRLARTIADLAGQRDSSIHHLSEAVQYLQLDRLSVDLSANLAKL
ncbi:MAG: hypothetical protein AAF736_03420 [Pseudomonadota bacterium]